MDLLPNNVFRANVGAVIINNNKEVLAFERLEIKGAWQFPQGGLNEGEEPLEAIYREIAEETSIKKDKLELITEYPDWLAYELSEEMRTPKHGRGQVQKWFFFKFLGTDSNIDIINVNEQEFSSWKWMNMGKLIEIAPSFRKVIYIKLGAFLEKYNDK